MRNPSRHQKASRSERRQWNLSRSRRNDGEEGTQRRLDIRHRQHYGEQWNNAHRLAEAKLWAHRQMKSYMFMQLYGATNAQLMATMVGPAMTAVAASAVRSAATFQAQFDALRDLLAQTKLSTVVAQTGKKGGKTSLLNYLKKKLKGKHMILPPPHPSVTTPPAGRLRLYTTGTPVTNVISSLMQHQYPQQFVGDEQHKEDARRRALVDRERKLDAAGTHDAPDVADYCYGYRVWSVVGEPYLRSIGVTDRWYPGQRKIARCQPGFGSTVTTYCQGKVGVEYYYRNVQGQEPPVETRVSVPGMNHACGLWGQWNLDHLPEFPTDGQGPGGAGVVMGLIRAGGKVVESDYGFRAEWADVVELYCNGWDDSTPLDQLGVRYQVPVVRLTKGGWDVFEDYYEVDEHDHAGLSLAHPDKVFRDFTPGDLYEED